MVSWNTTVAASGAETLSTMSYWLGQGELPGGARRAREGGDDIVGHHLLPVMELHATAQAEGPALEVVAEGPALGQVGLDDEVFAHARQAVEDEVGVDVLVARRHHHRVERVER